MTPTMINRFDGQWFFLSSFSPHPASYEGVQYRTAEHAFQAAKTLNSAERTLIRNASTPAKARSLGRKATLRPKWDDKRVTVMRDVIRSKFAPDEMRELLLTTGNAELIEGNTWGDKFWGQVDGKGQNWLGKLLMMHRILVIKGLRPEDVTF